MQARKKHNKPAPPKLPSADNNLNKVNNLRTRLVNTQAYNKAYRHHFPGSSDAAFQTRKKSFLSPTASGPTTSTFGGDVELSAYALTRNVVCRVWEPLGDSIQPMQEEFAHTESAHKGIHFLYTRKANPADPGELLRCGHFDLLLPEEDLPQEDPAKSRPLQKFCPEGSPPLYRVPCPDNGHCLFFAMLYLDTLLKPTISEDVTEISDDEKFIIGTSSESAGYSTDSPSR